MKDKLPDSDDAPDEQPGTESSSTVKGDDASAERPQEDDTGPEHEVTDDVGPETPPAELVRLIKADRLDASRGTFATFRANIRTIVHLYWLHENIRVLKKQRSGGATVGGADYIAAAHEAGVKRTMAYKIIEFRLFANLDDIWRRVEIEADQWRARAGHDSYPYPSVTKMISWYKPDRSPPVQDEDEAKGPDEPNQTPRQLADEVLRLTDSLTTVLRDLEQARADFRKERQKHDQDVDMYEGRLRLKDERIAYLEGRVKELEQRAPSEPTAVPEAVQRPTPEPVSEDVQYRLAARGRPLAEVKDLEMRHQVDKWRGPLSRARQLRADFLAHLDSLGIVGIPASSPTNPAAWSHQDGVVADELICKSVAPDMPSEPPASALVPRQEPDPEPAVSAASAVEVSSRNGTAAGRNAITQEIAKMLYGRLGIAKVTGSAMGLLVEGHDADKRMFLRADLKAHPEIRDEFAIEVLTKHEGRYVVRELPAAAADEQAKIAAITWDIVVGPEARTDLVLACKIAKTQKEKTVVVDLIDGTLGTGCTGWRFRREDLEWVLRKNLTAIKYIKRGVLAITATGIAGDYEFYLRGSPQG